ncbi:MAG: hypothetical protein JW909_07810 [Planctomycetes bacterium]|nr:hypothetical protein [Planctomycetota bacterium]
MGNRPIVVGAGLTVLLGAVLWQVAGVAVIRHNEYAGLEQQLRSSEQLVPPRRGDILDARGRTLATDKPSFDVMVIPGQLPVSVSTYDDFRYLREWSRDVSGERLQAVLEDHRKRLAGEACVIEIARLSGRSPEAVSTKLVEVMRLAARRNSPYSQMALLADLPFPVWETMKVRLEGAAASVGGVECIVGRKREYPYGGTGGHVIGYTGEMSRTQIESARRFGVIVNAPERDKTRFFELVYSAPGADVRRLKNMAGGLPGDFQDDNDFLAAIAACSGETRFDGELGLLADRFCNDYVSRRLTQGEKDWLKNHPYLADRRMGMAGVEARYNRLLSGAHGYRLIERSLWEDKGSMDEWKRYLFDQKSVAGGSLNLTLDIELQRLAEKAVGRYGRPAACALMKLDGSVLALASVPGYDPQRFALGDAQAVTQYLNSPAKPMLSRAYQEQYPLGSVMKVVDAVAGLEEGVILPQGSHVCEGSIVYEGSTFRCNAAHGPTRLREALAKSCNVYFFLSALDIGPEALFSAGGSFGLGRRTDIDLPGEAAGVFPERSEDGQYHVGGNELLYIAIGQGPMAVTPVQAARVMAGVASRGRLPRPFVASHRPRRFTDIPLKDEESWQIVTKGMIAAVHSPEGTAYEAFNGGMPEGPSFAEEFPYIMVAGKTGTAEHGSRKAGSILSHSWFAGFAPARAPEVAFAVVIENAGHGGGPAARASAEILGGYFRYTRKGATR